MIYLSEVYMGCFIFLLVSAGGWARILEYTWGSAPHDYPQAWIGVWMSGGHGLLCPWEGRKKLKGGWTSEGWGWLRWWVAWAFSWFCWLKALSEDLEGDFIRWQICLILWRPLGKLSRETWLLRVEATGSSSGSLGIKLFIDFLVGCVRLGKETELFAYQEEGSTH